ncbi:MAG: ABC transporter permease [Anaerolineaceae bacterium]|jgi:ABC-2 type transport system permease protein|nr:ABC transporter permease [Anaerolineaceae bacterium]
MKRLWAVMKKEFYHIWRDPRTLALILGLPAVLLILLGYGISGENLNTTLAVVDNSKTDASRAYIEKFTASQDFKLVYSVDNEAQLTDLIDRSAVSVGMILPEDFGRQLATNQPATVQVLVDGSMSPTDSMTVQLKLSAISQMASQEILTKRLSLSGINLNIQLPIQDTIRILYNPNGDQKLYMIPGLIAILLQVQTLLLSALSIVREREQGTMEQLIVTPVKAWELMLGKIIPYLLVSLINLFVLLWLSKLLFGIQVAGNYWDLILLSGFFIIGSLGMGVLISNLSQTQMQAVYLVVFVVLIPAIILSGLMFSRANMPFFTYWYSALLPVTYYLEITRGIILRGAATQTLFLPAVLPLVILSVVYFALSVLVFRKRI